MTTEDSPKIVQYRDFQRRLLAVREAHSGADSEEENVLLDEGDILWWSMTVEEIDYLNQVDGPYHEALVKCLPKEEKC